MFHVKLLLIFSFRVCQTSSPLTTSELQVEILDLED